MDTLKPVNQRPVQALSTNDLLTTIWASPSGSIWTGSANGNFATTAPIHPDRSATRDFHSPDPSIQWKAGALPVVRATGVPPNIAALWGTDDRHVFAGCYSGHIYFWDGSRWSQIHDGHGDGRGTIKAFGGQRADDVYAVGQDATLLHFDGFQWRGLAVAGAPNGRENFTGVLLLPGGDVLISANGHQGRVVQGTDAGMVELFRTPVQLVDMVALGERVFFATGDGAAELVERDIKMIKTFPTVSAWLGINRVFFVEPSQPVPAFVRHEPMNQNTPWARVKH
jgi:hypothetical protein